MTLLVDNDFVREFTSISDNLSDKYLEPAIREAQSIKYQEVVGTNLYDKLVSLVENETISEPENIIYKQLLDISQYAIAYQTISQLCMITSFKINNIGINQAYDTNVSTTTLKDVLQIEQYYQNKADFYMKKVQDFCREHCNNIPELQQSNLYKIKPTLISSDNFCPLFLGGKRGRNK